ncbi:hypothetical protein I4U23_007350 [Adineta vaga]|nr:hypothetical protein I4U23_007350 [Adineta vaga]
MNWIAAKSYYIGYSSIDRFDSIIFFYYYFFTWSIGIIVSLILPILYLFAPASLQTKRTPFFLIISLICLVNMGSILINPYMLAGSGEPNLSIHSCRFIVYVSTFAKPFGLYLTLLFSLERISTKFLGKFLFRTAKHKLLFQKGFLLSIVLGICLILFIRLYEVIKFVKNNSSSNNTIFRQDNPDTDYNSAESILTFQYCYRLMNIGTYGEIISFYIMQYWFEYVMFGIIALVLVGMILSQCCLPCFQQRSLVTLSVNTKFYFSLASSVILFELVLLLLHFIVDDIDYNNSDTQVNYLQTMLFVYNFRCIFLPFVICLILCNPLKQWFIECFIKHSYADQFDETDHTETMINR